MRVIKIKKLLQVPNLPGHIIYCLFIYNGLFYYIYVILRICVDMNFNVHAVVIIVQSKKLNIYFAKKGNISLLMLSN